MAINTAKAEISVISIHEAFARLRQRDWSSIGVTSRFQSTKPTQGFDHVVYNIGAFQSTKPTQGFDQGINTLQVYIQDFNPRSLRKASTITQGSIQDLWIFQSTKPTQGFDCVVVQHSLASLYFNPRSLRKASTRQQRGLCWISGISIHEAYARLRRR